MVARFYLQWTYRQQGSDATLRLKSQIQESVDNEQFDRLCQSLSRKFGAFDPKTLFWGTMESCKSSEDYSNSVIAQIKLNLADLKQFNGSSPTVAATETFRILRNTLRDLIETEVNSQDTYLDFISLRTHIGRLVSGPPSWRLQQIVALAEAGILSFPFGPEPRLCACENGRVQIESTTFTEPVRPTVSRLYKGYAEETNFDSVTSPLLQNLTRRGRITSLFPESSKHANLKLGGQAHPVNIDGLPQNRIWIFGSVTEGARYFTHYIASPVRGTRGYDEIHRCAKQILARQRTESNEPKKSSAAEQMQSFRTSTVKQWSVQSRASTLNRKW